MCIRDSRYPIEPVEEPNTPNQGSLPQQRGGFTMRSARVAAGWLVEIGAWRRRHVDINAAVSGILLLVLGVSLAFGALAADTYLHRGVEQGDEEPFVVQPTGDVLAANADLRVFAGGDLSAVADALDRGGFQLVRQPVVWSEIEISEGDYDWSLYDRIVDELSRRDIRMVAVILEAPAWSRASGSLAASDGPPVDSSLVGSFLQAFTSRYGDAVPFIQFWDKPNVADRWGGSPATAAEFLPYLAAAYNGAHAGNPEVSIITPELSVSTSESEENADLAFTESLYEIDGDAFFDIVALQLDGGTTSPDDRRISPTRRNFSRAVLMRELMIRYGDTSAPIWATSFGWARGGSTSESEQAEFVIRAIERAWAEWPWMGPMFQWAFLASSGSGSEPYALVRADGTATELYRRLASAEFQERVSADETGFAPMDSPSVSYTGGAWENQHLEGRTFRTTDQIDAELTFSFRGTGVDAVMRIGPESGNVIVEVDGKVIPGGDGESGDEWDMSWFETLALATTLVSGLDYGEHELTIRLVSEGTLTLGGLIVERDQPFVWPIILLTVGALIAMFFGIRSMIMLVGRRSGHLPRADEDPWPALPSMPDWRPGRPS